MSWISKKADARHFGKAVVALSPVLGGQWQAWCSQCGQLAVLPDKRMTDGIRSEHAAWHANPRNAGTANPHA